MNRYPKVLIISHNAFSDTNNMGQTLQTFFKTWPKNSIAQLYVYNELPNTTICDNFYRITDVDMLKSIINKKYKGIKITKNSLKSSMVSSNKYIGLSSMLYKFGSKRLSVVDNIRELIWKYGNWNNNKLVDFLEDFKPEVIFFAPGNYRFIFNITKWISKKYEIPVVTFFADDYYTYHKKSINPIYYINKEKLRNAIKEIINKSDYLFVISEVMMIEYENIFNKKFDLLLTGICDIKSNIDINFKKPIKIIYAGNLGLKRWEVLSELAKKIQEINNEEVIFTLEIYSSNKPSKNITRNLEIGNNTKFKGAVSAEDLFQLLEKANVLLHVESFKDSIRKRTKMSISTKLSNYLGLGKVILAIGPQEVASMKHLSNNNAGIIVTNYKDIKKTLLEISNNENNINEIVAKNSIKLAYEKHRIEKICLVIQNTLNQVVLNCEERKNS